MDQLPPPNPVVSPAAKAGLPPAAEPHSSLPCNVRVRVPGKVMIAGEYSVLWGGEALAFTIDRWLEARIATCHEPLLTVSSDLWEAPYHVALPLTPESLPYQPMLVASVVQAWQDHQLPQPIRVDVSSELRVQDGVGSSAALRLATGLGIASLAKSLKNTLAPDASHRVAQASLSLAEQWAVARQVYTQQRTEQGFGSGYDIATQLCGGLVRFAHTEGLVWPAALTSVPVVARLFADYLHVFVGGSGAPTKGVGQATLAWLKERDASEALKVASDQLVAALSDSLAGRGAGGWQTVFSLVGRQRAFFLGSPYDPATIHRGLAALPGCDGTWSYKTTGAGGEDALLLLGDATATAPARRYLENLGWQKLNEGLSSRGAIVEQG